MKSKGMKERPILVITGDTALSDFLLQIRSSFPL